MKRVKFKVQASISHPASQVNLGPYKGSDWYFLYEDSDPEFGFLTGGAPLKIKCVRNKHGHYVGDKKTADFLMSKGIKAELRDPKHSVCSVGYSDKDSKWYGWSHRAIVGFGIGDKLYEEDFGDDSTPFIEHGSQPIESFGDARVAASRFAESVASASTVTTPYWYREIGEGTGWMNCSEQWYRHAQRSAEYDTMEADGKAYGLCPVCKCPSRMRERRVNGDDECYNGHRYPSAKAVQIP